VFDRGTARDWECWLRRHQQPPRTCSSPDRCPVQASAGRSQSSPTNRSALWLSRRTPPWRGLVLDRLRPRPSYGPRTPDSVRRSHACRSSSMSLAACLMLPSGRVRGRRRRAGMCRLMVRTRFRLNERQVALLHRIAEGDQPVTSRESELARSVYALRDRGLVAMPRSRRQDPTQRRRPRPSVSAQELAPAAHRCRWAADQLPTQTPRPARPGGGRSTPPELASNALTGSDRNTPDAITVPWWSDCYPTPPRPSPRCRSRSWSPNGRPARTRSWPRSSRHLAG